MVMLHERDERLFQELQIIPDKQSLALLASLEFEKRKEEKNGYEDYQKR